MMTPRPPDLVPPEDADVLRRYLSWHALASEFMCDIVARGVPLAPTRDHRRALLHQVRTENSQAAWLIARVRELGGEVPEQDPALRELEAELTPLCDRSWLDFLTCGQMALRGYMNPYLRALSGVFQLDETFESFSREVMFPEVESHFRRALGEIGEALVAVPAADRADALARSRVAEGEAFTVFQRFVAMSYPVLAELGVDTAALEVELCGERERFWDRLEQTVIGAAA